MSLYLYQSRTKKQRLNAKKTASKTTIDHTYLSMRICTMIKSVHNNYIINFTCPYLFI